MACALGGLIGFIREKEKKVAGLRTHMLVCLGACLFTLLSIYMSYNFAGVDAGRIAANVVTGIGFLGAGAIIREGGSVRGITTAASIWTVAAIGLATGAGYYLAAVSATVLAMLILQVIHEIEHRYIRQDKKDS